jgi:hypothetical protein
MIWLTPNPQTTAKSAADEPRWFTGTNHLAIQRRRTLRGNTTETLILSNAISGKIEILYRAMSASTVSWPCRWRYNFPSARSGSEGADAYQATPSPLGMARVVIEHESILRRRRVELLRAAA